MAAVVNPYATAANLDMTLVKDAAMKNSPARVVLCSNGSFWDKCKVTHPKTHCQES